MEPTADRNASAVARSAQICRPGRRATRGSPLRRGERRKRASSHHRPPSVHQLTGRQPCRRRHGPPPLLEDAFSQRCLRAGSTDGALSRVRQVALSRRPAGGVVVSSVERAFGVPRGRTARRADDHRHPSFDLRVHDEGARHRDHAPGGLRGGRARLSLNDRVAKYLPEFRGRTQGQRARCAICSATPRGLPVEQPEGRHGTNRRRDLGLSWLSHTARVRHRVVVGRVLPTWGLAGSSAKLAARRSSARTLDSYAKREDLWGPLGREWWSTTTYNPASCARAARLAAKAGPGSLGLRRAPLRGSVQDEPGTGKLAASSAATASSRPAARTSPYVQPG